MPAITAKLWAKIFCVLWKMPVVELCSKIFDFLGKISLFWLVTRCKRVESSRLPERWALASLALSIVLSIFSLAPNIRLGEWLAIGLGIYRVFEAVIYQINVVLFDNYRARRDGKFYAVVGYRRSVVLLLLNYVEIIFWFALFYRNSDCAFSTGEASLNSLPTALHFSLITMTGLGNTNISPTETIGYAVTSIHMAIGFFMLILVLTTSVSWLPKPKSLDEFER